MDQNACSSPHLIVWLGDDLTVENAKKKFWKQVLEVVKEKYEMQTIFAVDKLTHLYEDTIELDSIEKVDQKNSLLYRIKLAGLETNICERRGSFGYFYEYTTKDISSISHIVNSTFQTLTYFGLEKNDLKEFVVKNRLQGIDRIVPIGEALNIGVVWDGYEIIRGLSRIVEIR